MTVKFSAHPPTWEMMAEAKNELEEDFVMYVREIDGK